jgi:hypothetical protein
MKNYKLPLTVVATMLLLAASLAQAKPSLPEQPWMSGTTTVTLSGETLTVSETGLMENYRENSRPPWYDACSSVTELVIEKEVRLIGTYAFTGCTGLKTITVKRREPPEACLYAFSSIDLDKINLYVPTGSAYAYRNARGWEIFYRVNGVGPSAADALWVILAGFFVYGFALWMYLLLWSVLWVIFKKIRGKENKIIKTVLKVVAPVLCLIIYGIWIMNHHSLIVDDITDMVRDSSITNLWSWISKSHNFQSIYQSIRDTLEEIFWLMYSHNYAPFFVVSFFLVVVALLYQSYRHYLKKTIKRPTVIMIVAACNAVLLATIFIARWI